MGVRRCDKCGRKAFIFHDCSGVSKVFNRVFRFAFFENEVFGKTLLRKIPLHGAGFVLGFIRALAAGYDDGAGAALRKGVCGSIQAVFQGVGGTAVFQDFCAQYDDCVGGGCRITAFGQKIDKKGGKADCEYTKSQ